MRIIISPAKKMNIDTDSLDWQDLPAFLSQTETLHQKLRSMSYQELKALWKCNDQIAGQNIERLRILNLRERLTPALLAYDGIQYRYMAPGVFTDEEFSYIQTHLRILSGFYGILRPFDGVIPYRLEMQAKLSVAGTKDLYAFWGDMLAKTLFSESDVVVNLASKEYSVCISRFLTDKVRFITCMFGEVQKGKVVEKGTLCKMARGEMVRFMAENKVQDPVEIKSFSALNYRFAPDYSSDDTYVFLQEAPYKLK